MTESIKKILHFFDKLEDKVRGKLSHAPLVYALVGGIGVVLFWRGIWHMADDVGMSSVISAIVGLVILLMTGVFVSAFIGNRLIISGLSGEKKLAEKTEDEIKSEESDIKDIETMLKKVEADLSKIEKEMEKNHKTDSI